MMVKNITHLIKTNELKAEIVQVGPFTVECTRYPVEYSRHSLANTTAAGVCMICPFQQYERVLHFERTNRVSIWFFTFRLIILPKYRFLWS